MGRLDGKISLITGASGGMGQVACQMFCAEGSLVVGTDIAEPAGRQLEEKLQAEGHEFSFVAADISTSAGVQKIADFVSERTDRLDVLYNNHGISVGNSILDVTEEEWDRIQSVNLKSVFLSIRAFAPLMKQHGGSIVNVSSVGGVCAFESMGAYGAAKAGVIHLSKCAAVDLRTHGIRVNAICPGVIDTPMPRAFVSNLPNKDEVMRDFETGHLVGRMGRSEEVVSLAVWLASDEATFMTGSSIMIDGGWSVR